VAYIYASAFIVTVLVTALLWPCKSYGKEE
jgi:hypothetical protein